MSETGVILSEAIDKWDRVSKINSMIVAIEEGFTRYIGTVETEIPAGVYLNNCGTEMDRELRWIKEEEGSRFRLYLYYLPFSDKSLAIEATAVERLELEGILKEILAELGKIERST